ncbi:hypothetical protein [Ralstonia mojiangensis]|uniref:hypothetical protein n=1 Tax=Ralstonia mojiangensis TaxID=2953895 RepID=UPI0020910345|nr:hypothetical protein [Ralstonia mojiangensis]MCO5411224.1 hypothetical protein [Ralstonia mojiangensis]
MRTITTAALVALALAGCGDDSGRSGVEKAPEPTGQLACTSEGVKPYAINMISTADEVEVCNAIKASQGDVPSVQFFQDFSKVVVAFKIKGSKEDARELSYQLMNVIEARGKSGTDDATKFNTADVVFRMYDASNGRITPRDVNIFLRNSGPLAHTLSDDGLIESMALVMERKKAVGL